MAIIKRGFVLYDNLTERFSIDKSETTSVIISSLILYNILEARVYATGMLLDVGCGLIPYKELFRPKVVRHVGVDWPNTLHKTSEVDAYSSNRALPFKDASFDVVLCTEVLEHSPDPSSVMKEMSRVLKPGGHLIITAPFFYWIHEEPWDYYRFTRIAFEDMAKNNGIDVVYIKPIGGPIMVIADLISKLLYIHSGPKLSVFFQRVVMRFSHLMAPALKKYGKNRYIKGAVGRHEWMIKHVSLGHIMVGRKP